MKRFIILLAILFICVPRAEAINSDQIIEGVTDFLINRAKENQFYIFENQLRKNNDLQKYFPKTYSYIADGDLKLLITTKRLLKNAVQNDLDALVTRTFAKSITDRIDLAKKAHGAMDKYVSLAQLIEVQIDGGVYPINVIPLQATPETREIINGFWTPANDLVNEFVELNDKLIAFSDPTQVDAVASKVLLEKARAIEDAFRNMATLSAHLSKYRNQLRINQAQLNKRCEANPNEFYCLDADPSATDLPLLLEELAGPLQAVLSKAARLATYLQEIAPQDLTHTERVIESIRFLEDIGLGGQIDLFKFKRHILFFARLADIEDSSQVAAILAEYTMPPVSFFVKREERTNHVMVSSYLGYAGGKTFSTKGAGSKNDHGIIAPVGLEISRGVGQGGSLSLLLAPVDFGYPVTLKMNGIEEKLSLSDIVAPGVYVAYGLPDYPVTFGVACQRGRKIAATDEEENRALFFVGYDMPILTLY